MGRFLIKLLWIALAAVILFYIAIFGAAILLFLIANWLNG